MICLINRQQNQMDAVVIESSLRLVNQQLVSQLSEEERLSAHRQFKEEYAKEMGKLTLHIDRQRRLKHNLLHLQQQNNNLSLKINASINDKMQKHLSQREQIKLKKMQSIKLMDEQWKLKMQHIQAKNKKNEREAQKKAEQIRKKTEDYWNKKVNSQADHSRVNQNPEHYQSPMSKTLLPEISKKTLFYSNQTLYNQSSKKTLNKSLSKSMISEKDFQIKRHKEISEERGLQKERENLQKTLEKLKKINETRQKMRKKRQKTLNDKRKDREFKIKTMQERAPEVKRKSIEKSHIKFNEQNIIEKVSVLDQLNKKKQLQEQGFKQRGQLLQGTLKRLKKSKIKKLVREAVNLLKCQALKE